MNRNSNRNWSGAAIVVGLCLASALGVASCGGDDGGGGGGGGSSSGLPRSTPLGSLNSSQAGTFCDWTNNKGGGYGRTATCADGSEEDTDPDKASCVTALPLVGAFCPTLTVGDAEDCANAIGADLCKRTTAAGCAAVNACAGS